MSKNEFALPEGTHTVVMGIGDVNGIMRGKRIPSSHWENICKSGNALSAAMFAIDVPVMFGTRLMSISTMATLICICSRTQSQFLCRGSRVLPWFSAVPKAWTTSLFLSTHGMYCCVRLNAQKLWDTRSKSAPNLNFSF